VHDLIAEIVERRPADAVVRFGDTYLSVDAARDVLDEAERRGVPVLMLEGFLIDGEIVYPALSRTTSDLSAGVTPQESAAAAKRTLAHSWASAPTPEDQMHPDAVGRHMIVVTLGDP
jgi:hypothetical protein